MSFSVFSGQTRYRRPLSKNQESAKILLHEQNLTCPFQGSVSPQAKLWADWYVDSTCCSPTDVFLSKASFIHVQFSHKWCMRTFPKDVLASNNKSLTKKWFWWKINLLSVFTAIFTTVKSKSMNKRRQQWQFEIIKKILRSLSYSVFNLSNKIHRVYAGWKCHLCALRKGTNYGKCGRKSTGTTVKKLMF